MRPGANPRTVAGKASTEEKQPRVNTAPQWCLCSSVLALRLLEHKACHQPKWRTLAIEHLGATVHQEAGRATLYCPYEARHHTAASTREPGVLSKAGDEAQTLGFEELAK